jgi:hypothetical protein
MQKHHWARVSLLLNLAGTLLLAFAFDLGSSDLQLVNIPSGGVAICTGTGGLIIRPGGALVIGAPCPDKVKDRAAILKANHPKYIPWGVSLILASVVLGWFFVETPEESPSQRAERQRQLAPSLKHQRRRHRSS